MEIGLGLSSDVKVEGCILLASNNPKSHVTARKTNLGKGKTKKKILFAQAQC